jgi:hypothetical protein
MAKAFGESNGSAIKSDIKYYKLVDGDNVFRMVGGLLPRYVYWLKDSNDKSFLVECLSFNRDEERFDNIEVDHVPEFFPGIKCAWGYSVLVIDPKDPSSLKVLNLKKKMLQQIQDAAEDLGDPTDLDKGYNIVVRRVKTGTLAYNVEYTVQVLKMKPEPVSDDLKELVKTSKTIDDLFPRQTPEEQLALLSKRMSKETGGSVPSEVTEEFDDVPF